MVWAAPATIENSLRERIDAVLIARTTFGSADDFEVKALLRDADKLARADAFGASLIKAEVYGLCGDRRQFEYWLANAAKIRRGSEIFRSESVGLSNLGYFSEAAITFEGAMQPVHGQVGALFHIGLINCCFKSMVNAAEYAKQAGIELDADLVELARKADYVLGRVGVSEDQVRRVTDVAGEVLREHNLLWHGAGPLIRMFSDDEGAGMLFQLYVVTTDEKAAQLTDEVLGLLIDRDIAAPGFSFSFVAASQ